MKTRECFVRYFKGESGIPPPFLHVFGPMNETLKNWLKEGMTDKHQWFKEVGFVGEPDKQFGNRLNVNAFVCPLFKEEVLQDDGRIRVSRNSWGVVVKVPSDNSVMAYPVEFPVKDLKTWKAMKERLRIDSGERFPPNWESIKKENEMSELPSFVGGLPYGFFGGPRELMGDENLLVNFYDNPDMVHDMMDTFCGLWCKLFSQVASETRVDFLFVWEDMCYRCGPLISPKLFREFMLPYYKKFTSTLRDAGVPLMLVDTDGNFTELISLFVEGGIDIVFPLEVGAGMNIEKVRKDYPALGLIGGVEKKVPAGPSQEIEAELVKVANVLKSGRYLPCSDHTVPPTVSYRQYVDFYRKIGKLI